ncbi:porin [Gillisia hiemivivida]|uniref:Porin n=2 Tax=Gillisia hiemivivida TaxID=291190 RepID=A0A5C6ZPT8_9FLAO|nr:porin [Gillisia hiemivivida]
MLLVFGLVTSYFSQAQDITNNKFGKGLVNVVAKDSSFSLKFAARFQSLYTGSWDFANNDNLENGVSQFSIRRARLKFEGFAYSPKVTYKIELGLSNRDISGASEFTSNAPRYILDAVLKWNFYENFELWAGQTKLPGNRERVISSANLQTVDRSLVNSEFNVDRDMGFQLHHFTNFGENVIVREALAISQGEGRNVTSENLGGFQYTGRVEILPFGDFDDYSGADLDREETPKLALGVSYDHNVNAVRTRSNSGSYMTTDTGFFETDINTFFVDGIFKYQGFSAMAEYAKRTADIPVALNSDGTPTGRVVEVGDGVNAQAGYLFKNNYEIVTRYTQVTLDEALTGEGVENQYTLGLSKYIVGHKLKVQTDVSWNDYEDNADNSLSYRLQIDIHF